MSRVRCDSSRSASASSAEVVDTPALSSSAVGLRLLAPDFKTLFLPRRSWRRRVQIKHLKC